MNKNEITGTKPVLICKLVCLVRYMLHDVSDIIRRIRLLQPVEEMLEPFVYITKDIQFEMECVRAWCNELRSLHSDDLRAGKYYMSWEAGLECDKRLIAAYSFTKRAFAVLNDIERMSRKPTKETALLLLQDFPDQAARIIRLHTMLEGVVMGLTRVTTSIKAERKTTLSTNGLFFRSDDQPLKLMWEAAVEGLLTLKEHQPEEWSDLLKRVYCWGCGQFEEPLPLDLFFDYAENTHNCRYTLEDGLFYILFYTGMSLPFILYERRSDSVDVALKVIPSDSDLAVSAQNSHGRISNLLKKEVFLNRSLREWCDAILRLERPRGWYEDYLPPDTSKALDKLVFGMKLVLAAQCTIDVKYDLMWEERPFLVAEAKERVAREVTPRLQAMDRNGIPSTKRSTAGPQAVLPQHAIGTTNHKKSADLGQSIETGNLHSPDSPASPKSLTRHISVVNFKDVADDDDSMGSSPRARKQAEKAWSSERMRYNLILVTTTDKGLHFK